MPVQKKSGNLSYAPRKYKVEKRRKKEKINGAKLTEEKKVEVKR